MDWFRTRRVSEGVWLLADPDQAPLAEFTE